MERSEVKEVREVCFVRHQSRFGDPNQDVGSSILLSLEWECLDQATFAHVG